jgi:hypothetical protein
VIPSISIPVGPKLKAIIAHCYRCDPKMPVLIQGHTGVGKSEIIQQAADDVGIEYIYRDLSLMEAIDMAGVPFREETREPKGKEISITVWATPGFLPRDPKSKGILVFEELNRAPRQVRTPCLQFLTTRTLNDYKLPDGWLLVAAINPPGPDYEGEELDAAHLSRFTTINAHADAGEWLTWAKATNQDAHVMAYIHLHRAAIFDGSDLQSNPRNWTAVSTHLKQLAIDPPDADFAEMRQALIEGRVGPVHAAAFLEFVRRGEKGESVPGALDLLDKYATYRPQLCQWKKDRRTDILQAIGTNMEKAIMALNFRENVWENAVRLASFHKVLKQLPADIAGSVRQQLHDYHPELAGGYA